MNVRSKKRVRFSGDMVPLPVAGADRTLADVRGDIRKDLAEGEAVYCLCCGSTNRVYARGLSAVMARTLVELYKALPHTLTSATITKRTGQTGGGDTSKLVYWGLIEAWPEHSWKITDRGIQFLRGNIRLPHKALIYHDTLIGFDTSIEVTIRDLIGKNFSLDEVLAPENVRHSVVEPMNF